MAFLFGIALWFFVMSTQEFQITMDVPVKLVRLPELLAVASKPPHTLPITVRGPAFDLIRMRWNYMNKDSNAVSIVIDLQGAELGATRKHLDAKNFSAPSFPNVKFVEPSNQLLFLDLELDTRIERNIPVKSNVTFDPAPGYIMTDVPKITPEQIRVSGARDALTRIFEIPTDSVRFDSLTANDNFKVKLNLETFPAYVTPSDSSVIMSIDIQKLESKTFRNIPVQLIGQYNKDEAKLSPDTISVKITGGQNVLDSINPHNLQLFVEINRFAIEDVDSLPPTVKMDLPSTVNREMSIKGYELIPDKVKLIRMEVESAPVDSLGEEE
jgi:hypothetical protein